MSDTPRTDIMLSGNSDPSPDEYSDLSNFCRQLERELTKANEQLEVYEEALDFYANDENWLTGHAEADNGKRAREVVSERLLG